jgi:methylmalonyl-CoA mutase
MLRTTTECMSAIIGGADAMPIYLMMRCTTKTMGDRIARNQLLILKMKVILTR